MKLRFAVVALLAAFALSLRPGAGEAPPAALQAADFPPVFGNPEPGADEDEESLRQRLMELTAQRAVQMSAAELRIAIAAAENDSGKLPPAAAEVLDALQTQADVIQAEANRKIALHKKDAIADLKLLQDRLTRDGNLDEAVAIRDLIRSLRMPAVMANVDPGNMSAYAGRVGKAFYFRVTGRTTGGVYGTNIYTYDSILGAAAVHAGILRDGQTGIIKVTMMPGQKTYQGTVRNGVSSYSYGEYPGSYRLEAVPLDVPEADQPKADRPDTEKPAATPAELPREPQPDAAGDVPK